MTTHTLDKEPKWRRPGRELADRRQAHLVSRGRATPTREADAMTSTIPSRVTKTDATDLVEMAWDPITRIVGSLGIYTKIDFKQQDVAECHSTSSIFRGYSIFMKGKDPRDAHFITSRICGICGDNHATCSCYAQNMAYGVKPPHLGEWIVNLGEAAEYMFDHNIFQENLVGVDYCERMVAETNPGVLEQANRTEAPHAGDHGYSTIADIMRALNPFTGEFYREALQVSRWTREMFCLMEGRHVHPSTLYPGGVGTVATIQLMTDYMTRLMRYVEFMKKVVPMHDDLFDFFYEALPGYEKVGLRRTLLGCWGSFQDPEFCNFAYKDMTKWGRKMFVTPGVVVDGKLVTNSLVDINLGIRILLGSSYYDDWADQEMFVTQGPAGQPGRPPSPVEPAHQPAAAEARPRRQVQLGDVAALVRRQGPPGARHRRRPARPAVVDGAVGPRRHRLRQGDRHQRADQPAEDGAQGSGELRVEDPAVEQHDRAQPGAYLLPGLRGGLRAALRREGARRDPGRPDQDVGDVRGPGRGHRLRLHRGRPRRAVSHHMVIRDGKIANYHPYPPTPWNANPRDIYGTPGPVRGRGAGPAALRGERPRELQGHRHHAHRAQLRPLPAVRRPHVPRRGQDAREGALAHAGGHGRVKAEVHRAVGPDLAGDGERIEGCSRRAPRPGRSPRERAEELVRLVVDLYGAGLERLLEIVHEAGGLDDELLDALAGDELVSSLLLVHGLHPYGVEDGCERALESVRPYLGSHGGDVELLEVTDDGVVRLRMLGSCDGCASSAVTLDSWPSRSDRGRGARDRRHRGRGRASASRAA